MRAITMKSKKKIIIDVVKNDNDLLICFNDDHQELYSYSWLAHHCLCDTCYDNKTNQKKVNNNKLNAVPSGINFNKKNQTLEVLWDNIHISQYTLSYLLKRVCVKNNYSEIENKKIKKTSFNDYMNNKKTNSVLKALNNDGIIILTGVPRVVNIIRSVAEIIAPIQKTIYGEIFNIRVDKKPINIAYTDQALPLHMDLPYYESPPGLQLLHCLNFNHTVQGGLSTFLDVVKVANTFMQQHPKEFNILAKIPACFQKVHINRKKPVNMIYHRPHFITNTKNELIAVNWSPPFEGPIKVNNKEMINYYHAYRKFKSAIDTAFNRYGHQFKLNTGEIVIFNNRRLLHGRTKIDKVQKKTDRWLQGCYISMDDFVNKFRTSTHSLDNNEIYHFANQNHLEHP